jgi:hypothetical protein
LVARSIEPTSEVAEEATEILELIEEFVRVDSELKSSVFGDVLSEGGVPRIPISVSFPPASRSLRYRTAFSSSGVSCFIQQRFERFEC